MEGSRTLCRGRGVEEEEVVSPAEGRHGRGHPWHRQQRKKWGVRLVDEARESGSMCMGICPLRDMVFFLRIDMVVFV
jgi:hypothetical protein